MNNTRLGYYQVYDVKYHSYSLSRGLYYPDHSRNPNYFN